MSEHLIYVLQTQIDDLQATIGILQVERNGALERSRILLHALHTAQDKLVQSEALVAAFRPIAIVVADTDLLMGTPMGAGYHTCQGCNENIHREDFADPGEHDPQCVVVSARKALDMWKAGS
jgi:hypothetical protein